MHVKLALEDHIKLHEPLPWDVYNDQNVKLLSMGQIPTDQQQIDTLIAKGAYVEKEAFERHRRAMELEAQGADPFKQWSGIQQRYRDLLLRKEPSPEFLQELAQLLAHMRKQIDKDEDVSIFAMMRVNHNHYAISHGLQVAVCGEIYGRYAKWSLADTTTLANAALTMNIAMLELQRELSHQAKQPTFEQREAIQSHPQRGREQLEKLGVSDAAWLDVVLQHHETRDGRGYPAGITDMSAIAEVLNVIDRYCALMCRRGTRDPLASNEAARELYTVTSGPSQEVVARLIKAFGLFPPGTFVRLANGESAVVLRRSAQANKPRVATLVSTNGVKLADPIERDTGVQGCSITQAIPEENFSAPYDPLRLYGYVT